MLAPETLIAVVDDESAIRTMLARVLRLAQIRVAQFSSGELLMATLPAHLPACVIIGVHMPGMTGLEVLSRMRSADLQVPDVLITASDDVSLPRLASEAGATQLLRKPFSSAEFAGGNQVCDHGKRTLTRVVGTQGQPRNKTPCRLTAPQR
ncbi:response regulator transcription factor [Variovorax rhizosphaerae]|uniref:Response regulator n=1 Tax=Variovorax rhizosphaerae TaxID=1836200 RepID=A0ABU8WY77_9BURK